jgi:hypothetical protein
MGDRAVLNDTVSRSMMELNGPIPAATDTQYEDAQTNEGWSPYRFM